ncbi:MAG: amino acid carrier protein, partial [Flammeovirgaceae bacterium]|nr:amino acid carrier protein [Flammeovirgaceae bacterium]
LGGPAALFWMLVTAFLGMTTKFVEVTLSHKYRETDTEGKIAGGPMYFMKNKLNMKWMAVLFAIATVLSAFGTGSLPQINSISNSLFATFGVDHIITGAVLAVVLGFVIIGGIKRIAHVTEKLVPGMAIIYFIGALGVIFYNAENIIPSFISIFADIFSGTAATGGFLGATMAFAINRGVNRGLFSNEAGQGSAPIAHAAARAHEPVSEGVVAILEPFIDTIVICSITGLVLLSSGVWNEKHENQFQYADITVFEKVYDENNKTDKEILSKYLTQGGVIGLYSGDLIVENGNITNELTIMHARSIAEDMVVFDPDGAKYSGNILVTNGSLDLDNSVVFSGKSLIHSAPLTAEAFKRSFFGDYGQYIVSIGLLLFAFSTAISWSYYGDRAITFLVGVKGIIYFRIVYVIGFFLASFVDTTIIWTLSGITIALMTLPNLLGIVLLHKDMKQTVKDYWLEFNREWPKDK